MDLPVLQALMGHDHADSSASYIHLAPAHVRAAYDAARERQQAAIDRTRPPDTAPGTYRREPDILTWLSNL